MSKFRSTDKFSVFICGLEITAMWFRDLTVLVIAVLVCRGESQSLTRFPPGACEYNHIGIKLFGSKCLMGHFYLVHACYQIL